MKKIYMHKLICLKKKKKSTAENIHIKTLEVEKKRPSFQAWNDITDDSGCY